MKNLFITTVLALGGVANATAIPILNLFNDGQEVDGGNIEDFVYRYRVAGSQPLDLSLDFFMSEKIDNMGLSRIDLRFRRASFNAADQQLVNTLVWRMAGKCMNIAPERKTALLNWLAQQNKLTKGKTLAQFGPMTVRFERFIDVYGNYLTVIGLGRDQKPGVAPWNNHCEYTKGAG